MRVDGDQGIPVDLAMLARRFDAWRRSRTRGARIPDSLWLAAVERAAKHSVSRTAPAKKESHACGKDTLISHCAAALIGDV